MHFDNDGENACQQQELHMLEAGVSISCLKIFGELFVVLKTVELVDDELEQISELAHIEPKDELVCLHLMEGWNNMQLVYCERSKWERKPLPAELLVEAPVVACMLCMVLALVQLELAELELVDACELVDAELDGSKLAVVELGQHEYVELGRQHVAVEERL